MVVGAHDAGPLTYKHGGVVGLYVITICLYVIVTSMSICLLLFLYCQLSFLYFISVLSIIIDHHVLSQ